MEMKNIRIIQDKGLASDPQHPRQIRTIKAV